MLLLDAKRGDAPTLMLTLTARTFPTGDELRRTLEKIVRACRRPNRWPEFEWFVIREPQARGEAHIHALVKHVPRDQDSMREFYEVVTKIWCGRHDARASSFEERRTGAQGLTVITDVEHLANYVTKDLTEGLTFKNPTGHRTSPSGGYFGTGAKAAREAAQTSLRRRRLTYRLQKEGVAVDQLDAAVDAAVADAKENLEVIVVHHGVLRGMEELRNPFEQSHYLPVRPRRRS